jgi:hypothetical protein
MKKSTLKILMSLIISSCFFIQCKKEVTLDNDLGLPSATETGAQTFACELTNSDYQFDFSNPYPFIADNDLNDPNYPTSGNGAWLSNDTLTIAGAPQIGSYFKGIQFIIPGNLQQGSIYDLSTSAATASTANDSTCNGVSFTPTTWICDSGTIQLTKFDTVNKIVSGTFSCRFPYQQCDFILYAADGRFDYKYK